MIKKKCPHCKKVIENNRFGFYDDMILNFCAWCFTKKMVDLGLKEVEVIKDK